MKLSEDLSNIALGEYWNDRVLKDAMNTGVLNSDDVATLALALHGIVKLHDLQHISVKLFNKGL